MMFPFKRRNKVFNHKTEKLVKHALREIGFTCPTLGDAVTCKKTYLNCEECWYNWLEEEMKK